jgi:hypothetical protein
LHQTALYDFMIDLSHEPADVLGEHEAQARRSPGTQCLDQEGKETRASQLQGVRPCREKALETRGESSKGKGGRGAPRSGGERA